MTIYKYALFWSTESSFLLNCTECQIILHDNMQICTVLKYRSSHLPYCTEYQIILHDNMQICTVLKYRKLVFTELYRMSNNFAWQYANMHCSEVQKLTFTVLYRISNNFAWQYANMHCSEVQKACIYQTVQDI